MPGLLGKFINAALEVLIGSIWEDECAQEPCPKSFVGPVETDPLRSFNEIGGIFVGAFSHREYPVLGVIGVFKQPFAAA